MTAGRTSQPVSNVLGDLLVVVEDAVGARHKPLLPPPTRVLGTTTHHTLAQAKEIKTLKKF